MAGSSRWLPARPWTWRCCPVARAWVATTRALGDRVRMLFVGTDGTARLAVGRSPRVLSSPVDGTVEAVGAGRLAIRAEGIGLAAAVGWGEPVHGRLLMGVASPDAELRASSIDIGAAGSILVAGARLDIEALTRARAIGVAGVICGGVVGRELRQLEESDIRQRASLHAASPFAVLTLDGYGRRTLPSWPGTCSRGRRPRGRAAARGAHARGQRRPCGGHAAPARP